MREELHYYTICQKKISFFVQLFTKVKLWNFYSSGFSSECKSTWKIIKMERNRHLATGHNTYNTWKRKKKLKFACKYSFFASIAKHEPKNLTIQSYWWIERKRKTRTYLHTFIRCVYNTAFQMFFLLVHCASIKSIIGYLEVCQMC